MIEVAETCHATFFRFLNLLGKRFLRLHTLSLVQEFASRCFSHPLIETFCVIVLEPTLIPSFSGASSVGKVINYSSRSQFSLTMRWKSRRQLRLTTQTCRQVICCSSHLRFCWAGDIVEPNKTVLNSFSIYILPLCSRSASNSLMLRKALRFGCDDADNVYRNVYRQVFFFLSPSSLQIFRR